MKKLTRKQTELLQAALARYDINPKWVRRVYSKWRLNDEPYPEGRHFYLLYARRLCKSYKTRERLHHSLTIFEGGETQLGHNIELVGLEYRSR
ncbi:hypothetical protein A3F56_02690 [Candidatus Kaiserbacteria bacterium RIFCSPHIGHO2_12_FULL_55_13]|nr:MAG: hypothetical protein A3F56_02690 [Candidatus Kaiserbacteria bacterium RIFCSPHIGHO2_12_FULL_55_13]